MPELPSELFSIEMLFGLTSQAGAVLLAVTFLKWVFGVTGRGAKLAAWCSALVIIGVVYAYQGMISLTGGLVALATVVLMWLLNSMLVTFVAMKGYEDGLKPLKAMFTKDKAVMVVGPEGIPPYYRMPRKQNR